MGVCSTVIRGFRDYLDFAALHPGYELKKVIYGAGHSQTEVKAHYGSKNGLISSVLLLDSKGLSP